MQRQLLSLRASIVGAIVLATALLGSRDDCPAADGIRPEVAGAVVRVINQLGDEACVGSGTFVRNRDGDSVVLTCAHLFTDDVGEIVLIGRSGERRRAVLAAVDERNDLACLYAVGAEGTPRAIATELPAHGSKLSSCGFGAEGQFLANHGELIGYVTLETGEPEGVLELTGAARHGDSGGPILNARGEVVAVIMGTDGKTVDGSHCRLIRDFLSQHPLTTAVRAKVARLSAMPLGDVVYLPGVSFEPAEVTVSE